MNSYNQTQFHTKDVDSVAFSRRLTAIFLFILTVVMSSYVIKTGNPVFMAGVVGLPFVLILMGAPKLVLVATLILNATMLPMPGFSQAKLGLVPQLILTGTYFLSVLLGHQQYENKHIPGYKFIMWYAVLLVVIIAVRGAGLRILGSTTWGGQRYIVQFLSIALFFVVPNIQLGKKHIRWVVWGGLIAGIVGTLITLKTGDIFSESLEENRVNESRATYLGALYGALFPVAYAFKAKRIRLINVALMLALLLILLATGFRGRLITYSAMLFLYGLFKARNKLGYWVRMLLLGGVAWGFVLLITPQLPLNLQRTLSIVPGTVVDAAVQQNADRSIEWRIELWQYALTQAHKYYIVGRGMTIDVLDVLENAGVNDIGVVNSWFYFQTHAYHSGPLTLLIDLGIPGVILYLIFSGYAIRTMWGYATRLAKLDSFESRFALFSCIFVIWKFIAFYLIFGGTDRLGSQIMDYALAYMFANSVLSLALEEDNRLKAVS